MKIVVDANVVISAAITSGRTREVLCLSDAVFLAPPELEQEVSDYTPLIAEKSGLSRPEVDKTIDILFQSIGTVSYSIPSKDIRKARNAIGNVDPKTFHILQLQSRSMEPQFGRMIPISASKGSSNGIPPRIFWIYLMKDSSLMIKYRSCHAANSVISMCS